MSAYLISWNPVKSSFDDERYRDEFPDSPGNWSIGRLKKKAPQAGDEFFFARNGARDGIKNVGLIGYGVFTHERKTTDHWDPEKAALGIKETYVGIKWTYQIHCLDHPEQIITLAILRGAGLTHKLWAPQPSMISIKDYTDIPRLKKLFHRGESL
jgi:hypothetical protein